MLHPITFSVPSEKICTDTHLIVKTKICSDLIPGDTSTYIYNTEREYYDEYKKSYFAITKKKGGWDCLRHYEIILNGCIPYFIDIEHCPINTMYLLPKQLLLEANALYDRFKHINIHDVNTDFIIEYNTLQTKLLEYLKQHLTTEKVAKYVLDKSNIMDATKILFLSGCTQPDYLRCLTLHGFKKTFGQNCHDYPKVPHIYKSNDIQYDKLYGKGMTYSNLLDQSLHNDSLDTRIEEDIRNKYYDIVIYGSYARGTPYYDLVSAIYQPNEIILICGEDEIRDDYKKYLSKGQIVFVREL
jgi:hypothetical protein